MKYLITVPSLCITLALLCFLLAPQAAAKTHRVEAELAGVAFATTVDSTTAKDILLNVAHLEQRLQTSPAPQCSTLNNLPSQAELKDIAKIHSPDTAMALLALCLIQIPQIAHSQKLFLEELSRRRRQDPQQTAFIRARAENYRVLFVPGWGYLSNADETGSDMAGPRKQIASLGFETALVALKSNGSVEKNAQILVRTLEQHFQSGKKIILVSASSGGPTVALALTDPRIGENPLLSGWLNICGVLRGSPVIDAFMTWPKSWLLRTISLVEGWEYQSLLSLSQARSQSRYDAFKPPAHLTIINYIGIAFSGQISRFGKQFYGLMKKRGPNDGLTLITDALAPGHSVLGIGVDHFVMEDPEIAIKSEALLPVMLRLIEARNPEIARGMANGNH